MPKYYRYTDRNGLIAKDQTNCPSGYFETPQEAIRHMLNNYNETIIATKKKVKRAAHLLNSWIAFDMMSTYGDIKISKGRHFIDLSDLKKKTTVKHDYPLVCVEEGDA